MVLVDVQVAHRLHVEIDQRMAAELLEHVIEEADPGGNGIGAGAVEVDGDVDGGLARLAAHCGGAHGVPHSDGCCACNLDHAVRYATQGG